MTAHPNSSTRKIMALNDVLKLVESNEYQTASASYAALGIAGNPAGDNYFKAVGRIAQECREIAEGRAASITDKAYKEYSSAAETFKRVDTNPLFNAIDPKIKKLEQFLTSNIDKKAGAVIG